MTRPAGGGQTQRRAFQRLTMEGCPRSSQAPGIDLCFGTASKMHAQRYKPRPPEPSRSSVTPRRALSAPWCAAAPPSTRSISARNAYARHSQRYTRVRESVIDLFRASVRLSDRGGRRQVVRGGHARPSLSATTSSSLEAELCRHWRKLLSDERPATHTT